MNKIFFTCVLLGISTCQPLLANTPIASSIIKLEAGQITPGKDIEIFFNKLLENVTYEVRCDSITSDGKSKGAFDYIALYGDAKLQPGINGILLGKNWQAKISVHESNTLNIKNVRTEYVSIIIRNLDDTDTLTVNNCYAFPQT